MRGLTDRQLKVLTFIKDFTDKNQYPPTVQEIAYNFDISIRSVQDHLIALQKKGAISSSEKRCRSIRVLLDVSDADEKAPCTVVVPVVGALHQGKALLCDENLDGSISVAEPLVSPSKYYFAFYVSESEMTVSGILKGDAAVIEQTSAIMDGQVAAVIIDNQLCLRRYYKKDGKIILKCDNPALNPQIYDNIRIEGVLSNIIRNY